MPIFGFRKTIGGINRKFEVVPSAINNSDSIYEANPIDGAGLTYIYRTDGSGDSSNNTGFFFLFKQGLMQKSEFTISQSTTNYIQSIVTANINNTDIWLYKLDQFGQLNEKWKQVPELSGNNAIYNSLAKGERNIYNVVTKNRDTIDLVFGDGNFSNIPLGSFKLYYRTSDNAKYAIQPAEMQNIQIGVPYIDANGSQQTLTIGVSLKASVYNASASESSASIREKAPQVYYSQNRMITAEDYQVAPLSASQEVIKVRSINRSASGISRAKEILDPTGAYSNVSVFADDGILYREETLPSFTFTFTTKNTILSTINSSVEAKLKMHIQDIFII